MFIVSFEFHKYKRNCVSMTSGRVTYLLECKNCGAGITATGTTTGGNPSCTHVFAPTVTAGGRETPQSKSIVYPTDAENKWLRIIDQNKQENVKHYRKFEDDASELSKFQKAGMQAIASMIATIEKKLDARKEELEAELNAAFEERRDKIFQNMKSLTEHKKKNEETKDSAEDLLQRFVLHHNHTTLI